jgi:hypothetical protein
MDKELFESLQKKITVDHNGYKIEKLAEPFLNVLVYRKTSALSLYIVALKKLLFIPNFEKLPAINAKTFFTFPALRRKDCLEIWNYVLDQTENKFAFRLSGLGKKFRFSYDRLSKAIRITKQISELNFSGKVYLTAAIYNHLLMIDDLEKNMKASIEKYVSFSCVMGIEHLMTQYFKKRGVPTYNLQHGVTFIYEKNLVDELEYHNIISDYHLAWGSYTRDELLKNGFAQDQVLTAGYPRKKLGIALKAPKGKNCLVFLSRKDFNAANLELLEKLAAFQDITKEDFHFRFKLHPSLNEQEYKEIIRKDYKNANFSVVCGNNTLQEILSGSDVDFCIVVNSTAYYECYMFGIPTLRFVHAQFDMSHPLNQDSFTDAKDFQDLLQKLYGDFDQHFVSEHIYQELDYVLGLTNNEYAQILS